MNLPSILKELSREPYKHSQDELKGLLSQYRQQLRILEGKLNHLKIINDV